MTREQFEALKKEIQIAQAEEAIPSAEAEALQEPSLFLDPIEALASAGGGATLAKSIGKPLLKEAIDWASFGLVPGIKAAGKIGAKLLSKGPQVLPKSVKGKIQTQYERLGATRPGGKGQFEWYQPKPSTALVRQDPFRLNPDVTDIIEQRITTPMLKILANPPRQVKGLLSRPIYTGKFTLGKRGLMLPPGQPTFGRGELMVEDLASALSSVLRRMQLGNIARGLPK